MWFQPKYEYTEISKTNMETTTDAITLQANFD